LNDADESVRLKRDIQSILNKLTIDKFDRFLDKLLGVQITSLKVMSLMIDIIFEKAVSEPNYCVMYARLCAEMAKKTPKFPTEDNPSQTMDFRRCLLTRCQKAFEDKKQPPEIDPGMTDLVKREELENLSTKIRKQNMGNIKFIGELFKIQMLPERVLHTCLKLLLDDADKPQIVEDDMDHFCQLLTTVGKIIETRSINAMDSYFARIDNITERPDTPPRIKFALMDITDLRANKWQPKREAAGPKTIAQVHKDEEKKREAKEAEMEKK